MSAAAGNTDLLLIAKAPVPGRVKTRLCPPCTPVQAAEIAAAALADTIETLSRVPAGRHLAVLHGQHGVPAGWDTVAQRGDGLDDRLANAFADAPRPAAGAVLVGMDTPQLTTAHIRAAIAGLARADAVLGPAVDGGWWLLGLRDPAHGAVLRGIAMSRPDTGAATRAALAARGLRCAILPVLRDVDTADDALAVAALVPHSGFAQAVRQHLPMAAEIHR
jgi:rSAM/selenodomain-associated transferase 1